MVSAVQRFSVWLIFLAAIGWFGFLALVIGGGIVEGEIIPKNVWLVAGGSLFAYFVLALMQYAFWRQIYYIPWRMPKRERSAPSEFSEGRAFTAWLVKANQNRLTLILAILVVCLIVDRVLQRTRVLEWVHDNCYTYTDHSYGDDEGELEGYIWCSTR